MLLLTYNGKEFVYDDAGNPISYNNGEYEYEWAGKQLTKFVAPDDSYTEFSYDANGIRTQKRQYKSDGTMEYYVDYYWQDGLLTQQMLHYYLEVTVQGVTTREEILISSKFIYDESNQPVGCVANGEAAYAFVRNLQGDIIAVVDQDGETLVEYSYDPWGKVTSTHNGENLTELEASLVMVMCPFAYRGYNYDFSTGLYYLQSRYYNPEWGRFLNCDDTNILLATQGETLGANLFAYCNNNPVNRVDYEGRQAKEMSLQEMGLLVGIVFLGGKALERSSNRYLLNYQLYDVEYSIDKYNLIYIRMAFYDTSSKRYYVEKMLIGDNEAWTDYILTESYNYVDFGKGVFRFFSGGLEVNHNYGSTTEKTADGMSSALFIATGALVYIAGTGIIYATQRSQYLDDEYFDYTSSNGMIALTEATKYIAKTSVRIALSLNSKPREYKEFLGL